MGEIIVNCANHDCDSVDVDLVNTVILTLENKQEFRCNVCGAEFPIYTRLGKIKLSKEISQ